VPGKLNHLMSVLCFASCATAFAGSPANLPVYFEDAHTGSFYWIIQNVPLDADYQLVLIDAHSDASEILGSDSIRDKVAEAAGEDSLDLLVRRWRTAGAIQCFNWIEPLIPHPITKVWWVAGDFLSDAQIAARRREVRQEINAHEMALGRREGDFGGKFELLDLNRFAKLKLDQPAIVSVDLDYFAAGGDAGAVRSKMDRVVDIALGFPRLKAITFAISRPYLLSAERADALLYDAMTSVARVINTDIHYEPFASVGEDRSERAKEFYRQRKPVPHYEVENAPSFLRTFFLQTAARIEVNTERERWEALLQRWASDNRVPKLGLWVGDHREEERDPNEIPADEPFRVKIENWRASPHMQVHWKVVVPAHEEYNLADERQGFADDAPKYLLYKEVAVPPADGLLDVDGKTFIPFLDRRTGWGTLRVYCEVVKDKQTFRSNVLRFSRYRGEDYTGKLTEIFNLPYVYGAALLRVQGKVGADARYGADCSNFIIYGKRREGWNIPYVNPKDLLPYLDSVDDFVGFQNGIAYGQRGPITATPDLVGRGLLLHFGKHVAAVFEADGGALTKQTRVVHQLETYPEITTFGALAQKYKQIRIMTFRSNR